MQETEDRRVEMLRQNWRRLTATGRTSELRALAADSLNWIEEAATTIATLRAEAEELRADAKRYKWLRDYHIGDDPLSINLAPAKKRGLDAAIDAAKADKEGA